MILIGKYVYLQNIIIYKLIIIPIFTNLYKILKILKILKIYTYFITLLYIAYIIF